MVEVKCASNAHLYGPYSASHNGRKKVVEYGGNKIYPSVSNIERVRFSHSMLETRMNDIVTKEGYYHLHCIDNILFSAAVDYFYSIGAEWCNLPLTTRMISSPGEVYSGEVLDYTTDALPIELRWFDLERPVFLAESAQFYLELRLLLERVDKVFAIYNSFRKERADYTHLSEFQHIEFEGKLDLKENCKVILGLLRYLAARLIGRAREHLDYFLSPEEVGMVSGAFSAENIRQISFAEAMHMLRADTSDPLYDEVTLKNFGAWEEIRLTEILGAHALVTEFPLYEIPFYHTEREAGTSSREHVAANADLILYKYRETVGGGMRIVDPVEIRRKASLFRLPYEDYEPYISMREYASYVQTSGFGLGWQRFVHWLLKLPTIWHAVHIPRGHLRPYP